MRIRPVNEAVVVNVIPKPERSPGGILVIDGANEAEELIVGRIGYLTNHSEYKVGDTIVFPAYCQKKLVLDGTARMIVKEQDILAVIEEE